MNANSTQQRSLLITRDVVASATAAGEDFNAIWDRLIRAGAREAFTPPTIGEYWPGQGGVYAGQVREDDGSCYHEILATVKPPKRLTHEQAMKWAATISLDGHSDFELPSRRVGSLLFANLPHLFEKTWYWLKETYAGNASYAWHCDFLNGDTYYFRKSYEARAVVVRRFVL